MEHIKNQIELNVDVIFKTKPYSNSNYIDYNDGSVAGIYDEDVCVYTIEGNIDVVAFEFKADNTMVEHIEKGQILKFRYNNNMFIEEFVIN